MFAYRLIIFFGDGKKIAKNVPLKDINTAIAILDQTATDIRLFKSDGTISGRYSTKKEALEEKRAIERDKPFKTQMSMSVKKVRV